MDKDEQIIKKAYLSGKEAIQRSNQDFHEWLVIWKAKLKPETWIKTIVQVLELNQVNELELSYSSDHVPSINSLEQLIRFLVDIRDYQDLYQLYSKLYPASEILESLIKIYEINNILITESNNLEYRNDLEGAYKLREIFLEIDTSNTLNIIKLISLAVRLGKEFESILICQFFLEHQSDLPMLQSLRTEIFDLLIKLLDASFYESFFILVNSYIDLFDEKRRNGLRAIMSIASRYYAPDYEDYYREHWSISDLIDELEKREIVEAFNLELAIAEGLSYEINKLEDNNPKWWNLVSSIASYYGKAGSFQQMNDIVTLLISNWPLERIKTELIGTNDVSRSIIAVWIFRLIYILSYCTDDIKLIRSYHEVLGPAYSLANKSCFNIAPYNKTSQRDNSKQHCRPLRVGYLSSTFYRHSVGYLCYETIGYHNRNIVQPYLYSYFNDVHDEIRIDFEENAYMYRSLGRISPEIITETIRQDELDILVFLDSLTGPIGCDVLSLRAAPIQMAWLGGDSPGLPEIDYFLIDKYLIDESSQDYYTEKLLRLPTYYAVESFELEPIDRDEFKNYLNIPKEAVVFITASVGYKRSIDCIDSQLEILKSVPNGILIVKGISDLPTVMKSFTEAAIQKGVLSQLRFLDRSQKEETHRGQLTVADLVLDTYPYTGSTHTAEALWQGIPVLTLVGRHYYGRMSFSQLMNIGEMEDCIAYSKNEYITKGIQLGLNHELRNTVKDRIRIARRTSVLWNPKRLSQCLESIYHQITNHNNQHELVCCHPFHTEISRLNSDPDWIELSSTLYSKGLSETSYKDKQYHWEFALECLWQGLQLNRSKAELLFNSLSIKYKLGYKKYATKAARLLLHQIQSNDLDVEVGNHMIKLDVFQGGNQEDEQNIQDQILFQCYLTKWLAIVMEKENNSESNRYWEHLYNLNSNDKLAMIRLFLSRLSSKQFEYKYLIDKLTRKQLDQDRLLLLSVLYSREYSKYYSCYQSLNIIEDSVPDKSFHYIDLGYLDVQIAALPSVENIQTQQILSCSPIIYCEVMLLELLIWEGMCIFHVNANIGLPDVIAGKLVGPNGKVYATENRPTISLYLHENRRFNDLDSVIEILDSVDQYSIGVDNFWGNISTRNIDLLIIDIYEEADLVSFENLSQVITRFMPIILINYRCFIHWDHSSCCPKYLESLAYRSGYFCQELNIIRLGSARLCADQARRLWLPPNCQVKHVI